ncbi:mechanosensitive ion channel family protein [Microbacterium sp. Marseille-Q6965]|uniref:mechanosensitive ion channel family protein n=1 Tax=Microbacterium sp. Marseille-Q6965 TaxID=2965072 RepID=UPI0021B75896|nr:mechanosensitive ion channel family protein [Microbacterium sp. Marseille-Q6965]
MRAFDTGTDTPVDPDFWLGVLETLRQVGLQVLWAAVTVAVCVLIAWVLRRVIQRVVHRIVEGAKSKADVADTRAIERSPLASVRIVQRSRTLGSILTNIVNVSLFVIAALLVIGILAPDLLGSLTLLSAAVGAGLGFGAQNIVKDVLNGIFIVAEDQIGIGDVVDVGLASGVVEYVSVRITHVRDVNGTLWYVRNGEILRIGNMSQGWSRVVLDVSLPADVDVDDVEQTLGGVAAELAHDPAWRSRLIGDPEVWGLESVSGDTLVMRLVVKSKPSTKEDVAAELRKRLRDELRARGVELPGVASVDLTGAQGALRVRGVNPPTRPQTIPARPTWHPRRAAAATERSGGPERDRAEPDAERSGEEKK